MFIMNSKTCFYSLIFKTLLVCILVSLSLLSHAKTKLTINSGFAAPVSNPLQTGFGDLVLKEAYKRIGYEVETVRLPAERALINANLGIDDGDLLRIEGLEKKYPNLIRVPEKIMDMEVMLFSKNKLNFKLNGWQSLANQTVTIVTGWKIFENNLGENVDVLKTDTIGLMFTLLRKDRADFAGYERWSGKNYLVKNNIKDIKFVEPPMVTTGLYTYLHKKHKDLVPKLAAAIKEMKADGTIQALFDKILSPLMNK